MLMYCKQQHANHFAVLEAISSQSSSAGSGGISSTAHHLVRHSSCIKRHCKISGIGSSRRHLHMIISAAAASLWFQDNVEITLLCVRTARMQVFHLDVTAAAAAFGMRKNAFQEACRRRGIDYWPYRKLTTLHKVREYYEAAGPEKDAQWLQ
jgi:hypothetical protein